MAPSGQVGVGHTKTVSHQFTHNLACTHAAGRFALFLYFNHQSFEPCLVVASSQADVEVLAGKAFVRMAADAGVCAEDQTDGLGYEPFPFWMDLRWCRKS